VDALYAYLSLNLLGEGLRDALDPQASSRREGLFARAR
jgi:ABC-type dipeptide/oligopeptide/nickel transport system permease subunit